MPNLFCFRVGLVVAVLNNNPTKVIERAKNNKVRTVFFRRRTEKTVHKLKSIGPDLIVLAGFY
jgi:folate-dependent phosphoribosylglycinamide formyltransferase PurN